MNYIIFSGVSWEAYSYKRLLDVLPEREDVVFAGKMSSSEQAESGIRSLSLEEIYRLPVKDFTVLVSSPYWLQDVLALSPAFVVALLEHCPEGEDSSLWDKYSGVLAAQADLTATASERLYLEQLLSRSGVVYLSGDSPLSYGIIRRGERLYFLADYEAVWKRSLEELWHPQDKAAAVEPWAGIQLRHRTEYYLSMCTKLPKQPTVHYLAASYLYLLGDERAAQLLTRSFELMLLHDYTDCLHSHYRFFSAMEAKRGNLELAVRQYEITAFTAEERAVSEQLHHWLDSGRRELVQAELYRLNEDGAAAIRLLELAADPEARSLLLLNYTDTFQWEKALRLQQEPESTAGDPASAVLQGSGAAISILQQIPVMEGTLYLLYGKRHAAIRSFLRAAGADQGARALFAEMADLEEAVGRLRGRIADDEV
ncbi:hypothetical protein [Paenibacillus sp. FSL R7-0331]|uniref:hypothetical protein n=1 Tax=Paenibacillus sp. FSL R7-0331 TaxID=1536773 RepID=UPI0004F61920|nr:hypothetical protein [Paenibacillus sp. FSL R7-0331]AIQ54713.1 hypothetical protein R70331_26565 [Paenibacillus sp. FSL R7-0331]